MIFFPPLDRCSWLGTAAAGRAGLDAAHPVASFWQSRGHGALPCCREADACVLVAGDSGPTVASASDIPGARGQGQHFLGLCLDSPPAPPLQSWDLAGKLGGRLFSGLGIKAGHCRDGGGLKEGNSLLGV